MPRTCKACGRDLDRYGDAPCCLHLPPCCLAFCFPCRHMHYQGPCAREAARDILTPGAAVSMAAESEGASS